MNQEQELTPVSAWPILIVDILILAFCASVFLGWITHPMARVAGVILFILAAVSAGGFFVLEPNAAKVLMLFGKYQGTAKKDGFYWVNPFFTKRGISLRARTFISDTLKVNDQSGNPIEIAAVIVWAVNNTYSASFQVEDYEQYVRTQSETALRHLSSSYPYDAENNTLSLRRNTDEAAKYLKEELQQMLSRSGVSVLEARLSHLAYAPEIAGSMLRRQQAAATIAARQLIVEGAVGMVEMALKSLEERHTVQLDDERKAAMVSNLLVVLCSEHPTQPVVNTGTLYG